MGGETEDSRMLLSLRLLRGGSFKEEFEREKKYSLFSKKIRERKALRRKS